MAGRNSLLPNTITATSNRQQKKLNCKDIEKALIDQDGLTTKAAQQIGISYFTLKQAIKDNPRLAKVLSRQKRAISTSLNLICVT